MAAGLRVERPGADAGRLGQEAAVEAGFLKLNVAFALGGDIAQYSDELAILERLAVTSVPATGPVLVSNPGAVLDVKTGAQSISGLYGYISIIWM